MRCRALPLSGEMTPRWQTSSLLPRVQDSGEPSQENSRREIGIHFFLARHERTDAVIGPPGNQAASKLARGGERTKCDTRLFERGQQDLGKNQQNNHDLKSLALNGSDSIGQHLVEAVNNLELPRDRALPI